MGVESLASFEQDQVVRFEQWAELFVDVDCVLQEWKVLLELDWHPLLRSYYVV